MIDRLLQQWIGGLRRPAATAHPEPVAGAPLVINLDQELRRDYAVEYPLAAAATGRVLEAIRGVDLTPLAYRSPGLRGYDWTGYLQCSVVRTVRFLRALARHVPPGGRILDYGSYFGQVALAARAAGYQVEAVDSYRAYDGALARAVALLQDDGVAVHDVASVGYDVGARSGAFDAVICAGVIEHVPHTPRGLMDALRALLRPGGVLILETPNLAYLYRRLALLRGESVYAPLASQYHSPVPFEGHHREYTIAELTWIIAAAGLELRSIDTFNFSLYAHHQLSGDDADYARAMAADPELREIIMAVAARPAD